ncbi:MAG: glycosyl hydrolase family 18 protein [Cyanobacteria bacterium P01_G01_bin.54]
MPRKRLHQFFNFILITVVFVQGCIIVYLIGDRHHLNQLITEQETLVLESGSAPSEATEYEAMQAVPSQPKAISDLKVTGWIPDWDFADGLTTLKSQADLFASVSPFWFKLNRNGELETLASAGDRQLSDYTRKNNLELIPTITSFESEELSAILNNPEAMARHIDAIMQAIQAGGYDGIDLDYESISLADKALFFEFLQKLSLRMKQQDKKLVFTAHPQWGKDVIYSELPQTRKVQDYKRIANWVDELRIMAYEYTGRDSPYYGPNAPLPWVEDILRYAILAGVPREKLVLGISTYAYDYARQETMPELDYYPVFNPEIDENDIAAAYYNNVVDKLKASNPFSEEFDSTWGEMVLRYKSGGRDRVIIYPNDQSIQLRKELAANYGIRGVAYWRLGDEGSLQL